MGDSCATNRYLSINTPVFFTLQLMCNICTAVLEGLRLEARGSTSEEEERLLFNYTAEQMLPSVKLAMSLFRTRYPTHDGELKIVVHASLNKEADCSSDARFHVSISIFCCYIAH